MKHLIAFSRTHPFHIAPIINPDRQNHNASNEIYRSGRFEIVAFTITGCVYVYIIPETEDDINSHTWFFWTFRFRNLVNIFNILNCLQLNARLMSARRS